MKVLEIYSRFSMFWLTILLGMLYWVPSLLFYEQLIEPVKLGTYSAALVVMIIVFLTWLPAATKAYWRNDSTGPNLLILAVFLVAFVFLQSAAFRFLNFRLGRPDWIWNSPIGGFIAYQIVMLGILITVAVARTSGVYLEDYKRRISWALFIGGLVVGVFLGSTFSNMGML